MKSGSGVRAGVGMLTVALLGLALLFAATLLLREAERTGPLPELLPAAPNDSSPSGTAERGAAEAASSATGAARSTLPDAARSAVSAAAPAAALQAAQAAADAQSGRRLAVSVSDPQGRAVADARVELWAPGDVLADQPSPGPGLLRTARTDAAGLAVLDVDAADQQLVAFKAGVGSSGVWSVGEARAQLDERGAAPLLLRARALLTGSVLHADGLPAADALVVFRPDGALTGGGRARLPDDTRTDARGRFRCEADADGYFGVSARVHEGASPEVALTTRSGERHELALRFLPDFVISGVLQLPDGRPLAGGRIGRWLAQEGAHHEQGRDPEDRSAFSSQASIADADGRFTLNLRAPGRYTLVGSAAGWAPSGPVEVILSELRPRALVTLQLAAPASIGGVLLAEGGQPWPGARVRAWPAAWRFDHSQVDVPDAAALLGSASTTTAADGRFTLEGLHPEGSYRVSCTLDPDVEIPGLPRVLVEPDVPAGTLDLRLIATAERWRGAVLAGRVLDSLSGQPVEDFEVSVSSHTDPLATGTWRRAAREAGGRFRFDGLVPGDQYRLRVWSTGETARATVETDWITLRESADEVLVVLPRCGSLEVFVQEAHGTALPAAQVRVLPVADAARESRFAPLSSDERGRAFFAPVEPGRYAIRAVRGALAGEVLLDIGDGEAASIRLALQPEG